MVFKMFDFGTCSLFFGNLLYVSIGLFKLILKFFCSKIKWKNYIKIKQERLPNLIIVARQTIRVLVSIATLHSDIFFWHFFIPTKTYWKIFSDTSLFGQYDLFSSDNSLLGQFHTPIFFFSNKAYKLFNERLIKI